MGVDTRMLVRRLQNLPHPNASKHPQIKGLCGSGVVLLQMYFKNPHFHLGFLYHVFVHDEGCDDCRQSVVRFFSE